MRTVLVLAADAYRMIDALRDYADILKAESESYSMHEFARNAADNIENAPRSGGLLEVNGFDFDAAHSAVIGVMTRKYEKAQDLRDEAAHLDADAKRLETFLDVFTG
jgi:hypothetical protein